MAARRHHPYHRHAWPSFRRKPDFSAFRSIFWKSKAPNSGFRRD